MGQEGLVRVTVWAAIIACVASSAADAAARQEARAQAAPQSLDARYQSCRALIFRKYGRNSGDGRLAIDRTRMVELADNCVRNGGRL